MLCTALLLLAGTSPRQLCPGGWTYYGARGGGYCCSATVMSPEGGGWCLGEACVADGNPGFPTGTWGLQYCSKRDSDYNNCPYGWRRYTGEYGSMCCDSAVINGWCSGWGCVNSPGYTTENNCGNLKCPAGWKPYGFYTDTNRDYKTRMAGGVCCGTDMQINAEGAPDICVARTYPKICYTSQLKYTLTQGQQSCG
jgi:hypothetical protein